MVSASLNPHLEAPEGKSPSKFILLSDRIQFFEIGGLSTLFPCCVLAGAAFSS